MNDEEYFGGLAAALRTAGVPADDVPTTVSELRGHLTEAGTTALDEFGPVAEFAAELTGHGRTDVRETGGRPPAEGEAETWRWTADIYADRRLLNQYGAEGWEVERVDRLGLFVSRRVPGAAMRWEYRREATDNAGERAEVAAELAPEGWEPCGDWRFMTYFKRPVAATTGPAAELASTPARPGKRVFLSRRTSVFLIIWVVFVAGAVSFLAVVGFDTDVPGLAIGAGVGAVVGGLLAALGVRRDVRRGVSG